MKTLEDDDDDEEDEEDEIFFFLFFWEINIFPGEIGTEVEVLREIFCGSHKVHHIYITKILLGKVELPNFILYQN